MPDTPNPVPAPATTPSVDATPPPKNDQRRRPKRADGASDPGRERVSDLLDERSLILRPQLAKRIGVAESIVFERLDFLLLRWGTVRDGRRWVYNTYEQWRDQHFPFWHVGTIRNTFARLKRMGLVLTRSYGQRERNSTLWYALDYLALDERRDPEPDAGDQENADLRPARNAQVEVRDSRTSGRALRAGGGARSARLFNRETESTKTESTTETTTAAQARAGEEVASNPEQPAALAPGADPPPGSIEDAVVAALRGEGVAQAKAVELARLPTTTKERVAEAIAARRKRSDLRNPAGFVIDRLENPDRIQNADRRQLDRDSAHLLEAEQELRAATDESAAALDAQERRDRETLQALPPAQQDRLRDLALSSLTDFHRPIIEKLERDRGRYSSPTLCAAMIEALRKSASDGGEQTRSAVAGGASSGEVAHAAG